MKNAEINEKEQQTKHYWHLHKLSIWDFIHAIARE